MAVLTPAQICQRLVDAIVSGLSTPGVPGPWLPSTVPFELFPQVASGEHQHHGFVVHLPSTAPHDRDRQTRQSGVGTYCATSVTIRWAHVLRPEAVQIDTIAALEAEQELLVTLRGLSDDPLILVEERRSSTRDGLVFLGESRWLYPHSLPTE